LWKIFHHPLSPLNQANETITEILFNAEFKQFTRRPDPIQINVNYRTAFRRVLINDGKRRTRDVTPNAKPFAHPRYEVSLPRTKVTGQCNNVTVS
jgi:hypothetical protein